MESDIVNEPDAIEEQTKEGTTEAIEEQSVVEPTEAIEDQKFDGTNRSN
jgi:hypothetical protein